jgi:hypothetical protein
VFSLTTFTPSLPHSRGLTLIVSLRSNTYPFTPFTLDSIHALRLFILHVSSTHFILFTSFTFPFHCVSLLHPFTTSRSFIHHAPYGHYTSTRTLRALKQYSHTSCTQTILAHFVHSDNLHCVPTPEGPSCSRTIP